MQETIKSPAIGVSITANVGKNRQIVLQGFYEQDAGAEAGNRLIDQLCAVVDRKEATYDLEDLSLELTKHQTALARFHEDWARLEPDELTKQARLKVQLDEMEAAAKQSIEEAERQVSSENAKGLAARDAEFEAGYAEARAAGRQGKYTPKGFREANLARLQTELARVSETNANRLQDIRDDFARLLTDKQAELDGVAAEFVATRSNLQISINRYEQEIARIEDEIAKRRRIVG